MKNNFISKIKVVFAVALVSATTFVYGQHYTIVPNDTITLFGVFEDLQTLSIQQKNISSDTINFKWRKVSASVPPFWEASVCDNYFCNTSLVDSGMMNPVIPNEYGLLLVHCTPHINFGTAIIRYLLWDIANPSIKDTLTYIISVTPTGINTTLIQTPHIYFNGNKLFLKNIYGNFASISICNLNGAEVFNANINNKTEFDLPELLNSVYIIQLKGKMNSFQQKIFYQQ